jgi:small conductance mechanosensitive channel
MATALAAGVQGLISDILAGILLLADPNFSVGTAVSVGGVDGTVEEVNIRKTHVRDGQGRLHIIPNRSVDASAYVIASSRSPADEG